MSGTLPVVELKIVYSMVPTASDEGERAELLRARMEIFKIRFVQRAADDAAGLLDALSRGDRAGLQDRAHRLAGIAATFGHPDIGDEASTLQQAITAELPDDDVAVAVQRLIALLNLCHETLV